MRLHHVDFTFIMASGKTKRTKHFHIFLRRKLLPKLVRGKGLRSCFKNQTQAHAFIIN